jgi:arylsulfatase A-like enzyme
MAYRMQTAVPELTDLKSESKATLEMYGLDENGNGDQFARNCLLARRMAERGVRFTQLFHRGWDQHSNLPKQIRGQCSDVDKPTAALIKDLKARGMLDDTLVVWGGEFGRTPMAQTNKGEAGRDHHMKGFSMFLAGGGVRGGITHGATDELGYHAVDDVVHVHDLHATMLHLLGVEHTKLTYKFQGRDFRLTDVHGSVVTKILA